MRATISPSKPAAPVACKLCKALCRASYMGKRSIQGTDPLLPMLTSRHRWLGRERGEAA